MRSSTQFLHLHATNTPPSPEAPVDDPPAHPDSADEPDSLSAAPSPQKRRFEISLHSDESSLPTKRPRKIFTTISATREKAAEDQHAARMLQLACATQQAFFAQVKYRETRIHELDIMRTIAHDEYEEAVSLMKVADLQVGELRQVLATNVTQSAALSNLTFPPVLSRPPPFSGVVSPAPVSLSRA